MLNIENIITSPSSSKWLKDALTSALQRDPVDAVRDVELLSSLLNSWADNQLAELANVTNAHSNQAVSLPPKILKEY